MIIFVQGEKINGLNVFLKTGWELKFEIQKWEC